MTGSIYLVFPICLLSFWQLLPTVRIFPCVKSNLKSHKYECAMYLICYIVYKGDIITCIYTYKTNNIHRSVIIRLCKLLVVSSSGPGLLLLAARLLAAWSCPSDTSPARASSSPYSCPPDPRSWLPSIPGQVRQAAQG